MAEIKTVVSGDLTIRKITGAITAAELLKAVRQFYAGHITKNVMWDISESSLGQLTSEHIRSIAELVHMYAEARIGGKTAIVAPADLEYGISRMLSILAELIDIPFDTQTFRTLSEATEWMGVDKLPTFDAD